MKASYSGIALAWLVSILLLNACGSGGSSGSTATSTPPPTLTGISINPSTSTIAKGVSAVFSAAANYSDDSSTNITNQVTWLSSNTAVAIINSSAIATGVAIGSTSISTSWNGFPASANLTVTSAAITGVSISSATASTPKGRTVTFTATATFSDGTTGDVSGSANWLSTNASVATISASGIASSLAQGTTSVTASANGITSNALTLTVTAPALVSISNTPASTTVAKGLTANFTATGTYTDGSTADITSLVTWSSGNTAISTINSTTGLANGVDVGTTSISSTLNGITAPTSSITVTVAVVTGIVVTKPSGVVPKGLTVAVTATGTYSDGTTGNISGSVNWVSSNSAAVTINASGIATIVAASGSSNVYASTNGMTSNTLVIYGYPALLTSIDITPVNTTIAAGLTAYLTATGTYTDSTTADLTNQVTWCCSTPTIATINSVTGVITGVALGRTLAAASLNGFYSNDLGGYISVITPVLTSISISPATPAAFKGLSVAMTATGTYSDGTTGDISGSVNWFSSNQAIATINMTGSIATWGVGTSNISASIGGITSNSRTLNVFPARITAMAISPVTTVTNPGLAASFIATALYTDGSTSNISNLVNWSSGSSSVATINSSGVTTGVGLGGSAIHATVTSSSSTPLANGSQIVATAANLSVIAPTIASITITPATLSMFVGSFSNVVATATYSDTTTANASGNLNWSSSNSSVASVDSVGNVYAGSQGTTDISGSANGVTTNVVTLTVTTAPTPPAGSTNGIISSGAPAQLLSISIPQAVSVAFGQTVNLTATGWYSNGSWADITSLVNWLSGNTSIASIDATGLATGFTAGTSTTISAGLNGVISNTSSFTVGARQQMAGGITGTALALSTAVSTLAGTGATGAANGPGTAATFANPAGITTDGTNLYIADSSNNVIRQVVISTGDVTTLAGSGSAGALDGPSSTASFNIPKGITTDGTYLYVADLGNFKIRKVVIATGAVSTLAGSGFSGYLDGTGIGAAFAAPVGITTDGINLYVADNIRMRQVAISTGATTTLVTNEVASVYGAITDLTVIGLTCPL